jgi:chromosome partitioning protein
MEWREVTPSGRGNIMALTISFLNKKGGVGKTSTCHHLAGSFAKSGRSVLLIDMDPQASLTQGFWGSEVGTNIPKQASVCALFDEALFVDPRTLVRPTAFERISLVPGSDHLTRYNLPDPDQTGDRQLVLRDFVADVGAGYDFILIDCPPNIQACSWAALVASDTVVVPLQAEDYGAQGITSVQAAVRAVRDGANSGLRLMGYLITMFNKRLGIHLAYEGMLRQMYGTDVFTTNVPLATPYKEAIVKRMPVGYYKPRVEAAKVMDRLAEEVFSRAAVLFPDVSRRVA